MGECTKSIIMPGSARRTIQSAPTSTKHCSPGVSEPHPLARFRDQSPADQPGGRRRVDPVQATTLDVGGRHARALPLALAALHVFQVTPHRVCQAQDWSPSFRAGALHLAGVPIFTRECVEDLEKSGNEGEPPTVRLIGLCLPGRDGSLQCPILARSASCSQGTNGTAPPSNSRSVRPH